MDVTTKIYSGDHYSNQDEYSIIIGETAKYNVMEEQKIEQLKQS